MYRIQGIFIYAPISEVGEVSIFPILQVQRLSSYSHRGRKLLAATLSSVLPVAQTASYNQ